MAEELRSVCLISGTVSTQPLPGKNRVFPTGMDCKLFPRYLAFTGGTVHEFTNKFSEVYTMTSLTR